MQYLLVAFFTLLPTYLLRFNIGFLPTTVLEILIWIIFVAFIVKITREKSFAQMRQDRVTWIRENKTLSISIFLFLIAATISIFTSINTRAALGEWKAFYVEPIIIFFILIFGAREKKYIHAMLTGLLLCGLVTSLLSIYQHFTGWLVPHAFWANRDTYRITAWYGFPNAVGLFLGQIFMLALYMMKYSWGKIQQLLENENKELKNSTALYWFVFFISLLCIPSYMLAILYAKSTGAIIGIAGGIGLLLFFWKKTRWWAVSFGLAGFIGFLILPNTHPIKEELLFQDRSGQIRISIWKETARFLKDTPLTGAGLASYSEKIKPYHTTVNGEGIEIFHHPHNIFLTMWVNLGLVGLISFVGIIGSVIYTQYKKRNGLSVFNYFVISSFITIIITGLVDSPYIKNDLAILFWFIIGLLYIPYAKLEKRKT